MPEKKFESLDYLALIQSLQEADLPLGKMTEIDGGDRVFYVIPVAKENIASSSAPEQVNSDLTKVQETALKEVKETINLDGWEQFITEFRRFTDQFPWMDKEVSSFERAAEILWEKIFVNDPKDAFEPMQNLMERLDAIMVAFDLGEQYLPILHKDKRLKLGPGDKPFKDARLTPEGKTFTKLINGDWQNYINEVCQSKKLDWRFRIISDGTTVLDLDRKVVNSTFFEFSNWSYNEKALLIIARPWAFMNQAFTKTYKEGKGKYT